MTAGSGELQTVHHSAADLTAIALSADGALAAFSSAHRSTGLEHSLLTADTARGEPGPELWDGPGTSILVHAFAPGDDDRRLVATTNASGRERAFVWDAGSGERWDLPAGAPGGDVLALDWSPDGREILLCRIDQAEHQLLVWNLDVGRRPCARPSDRGRPGLHAPHVVLLPARRRRDRLSLGGLRPAEAAHRPRPGHGPTDADDPRERRGARRARLPERVLPDHRRHDAAAGLARGAGRRAAVPGDPRDARRPDRGHVSQLQSAAAGVPRRGVRGPVAQLPRVDDLRP